MKSFYTIRVALVISLGGFLFGFDASVISGVIEFVKPQFDLDDIQIGWVVSSPSFAAMFAMLIAGTISDFIGRKKVLIYAALLYTVSALLSAIAPGYAMLVIARMIGGLAFGSALVIAPIYIAELAPAEERGKLVSIQQLNIVLGFTVSYFSNYFLLNTMESGSTIFTEANTWRWMLGIEFIPAFFYFLLMFMVPRSPRWLLLKGKVEDAEKVLDKIYGDERSAIEKTTLEENITTKSQEKSAGVSMLFAKNMKVILIIASVIDELYNRLPVSTLYYSMPRAYSNNRV